MAPQMMIAENLRTHVSYLSEQIGARVAGTAAEAAAADYIAAYFRRLGLETTIQEFPCITWRCQEARLLARFGARWREIPIQPNTQTPSTPDKKPLEGELIYLESAAPWDLCRHDLRGKIGLLFGQAYASYKRLEQLCESGLAALLYVDDRFPFSWRVASGLIAGWIDRLTIPTATIPYMHAWELVRQGVRHVRLTLDVDTFQSRSQNVIALWPGTAKRRWAPLVLGAHHDSVALGVGAEDDGSGVAVVLELARFCVETQPPRPLRFVTFGWEENLSEGARHYVIASENKAEETALMLNFDSLGSWLGKNHIFCVGPSTLRRFVAEHLRQRRFVAEIEASVSPFSDQFAFNLIGVPSLWFHRSNFPGSRFYHHSEHDQIAVLDFEKIAEVAQLATDIVLRLSARQELPFERAIPACQQQQIVKYRRELYDVVGDFWTPGLLRPRNRPWRDIPEA